MFAHNVQINALLNSVVKISMMSAKYFEYYTIILRGGRFFVDTLYSVPAQETAKHRAKFGWLPLSDVAAVTKPRRETR